jgi:hypothetical protein
VECPTPRRRRVPRSRHESHGAVLKMKHLVTRKTPYHPVRENTIISLRTRHPRSFFRLSGNASQVLLMLQAAKSLLSYSYVAVPLGSHAPCYLDVLKSGEDISLTASRGAIEPGLPTGVSKPLRCLLYLTRSLLPPRRPSLARPPPPASPVRSCPAHACQRRPGSLDRTRPSGSQSR